MLLEYGANPNVHGDKPKYYQTPLHQATTQKVVQNLLKYGADPNATMMKSNDKAQLTILNRKSAKNIGTKYKIQW